MARINSPKRAIRVYTYEGGKARKAGSPIEELKRTTLACLLWEKSFYESGDEVSGRIEEIIPRCNPSEVAELAVEAREAFKLRHIPLFIVRNMAKYEKFKPYVARTLTRIIQRPDEITEFLAIYWKDGKKPLAGSVKRGLRNAFAKFGEYQYKKWNRKSSITLKNAIEMLHPKPVDEKQSEIFKHIVNGSLGSADTWEVGISAARGSSEKRAVWERLLSEKKLGAMALLMNLRNMQEVGVSEKLIHDAFKNINVDRILPYRFITAAKYIPKMEAELEQAMFKCLDGQETLPGKTVLLVDVSGSMAHGNAGNSKTSRWDAACGLAILARELCEKVAIYSFSNDCIRIPNRRGFALGECIINSQSNAGTYLKLAIEKVNKDESDYDRIIVLTDEQSHDGNGTPLKNGYIVNVSSYQNGIGYGNWITITGWSERVLNYISNYEKEMCEKITKDIKVKDNIFNSDEESILMDEIY